MSTRQVSVREARRDPGVRAARERFGGIDIPSSLIGMLAALALTAILAGLVGAAIGVVGYQKDLENELEELSLASLIGGIAVLFVSFLVGGWAAARMARYDGVGNGLMTAVWAIILAAIASALAAAFGDEYDVLRDINMPQWFSTEALTAGAIISGAVAILAMLLGGALGGLWGESYHRRADATILSAPAEEVVHEERVREEPVDDEERMRDDEERMREEGRMRDEQRAREERARDERTLRDRDDE